MLEIPVNLPPKAFNRRLLLLQHGIRAIEYPLPSPRLITGLLRCIASDLIFQPSLSLLLPITATVKRLL